MQSITAATQRSATAPQTPTVAQTPHAPHDPTAQDLYALVVHLQKSCNTDVYRAFGALELSLTQLKLLHHLENQLRPLTLGEAGELVHVSLPATSRLVDDLVRRGFVERYEDPEDRRIKRVSLTEDGRAVIRTLNSARLDGLEQFVHTLGDEERAALTDALTKLLARPDIAACRLDTRPEPAR